LGPVILEIETKKERPPTGGRFVFHHNRQPPPTWKSKGGRNEISANSNHSFSAVYIVASSLVHFFPLFHSSSLFTFHFSLFTLHPVLQITFAAKSPQNSTQAQQYNLLTCFVFLQLNVIYLTLWPAQPAFQQTPEPSESEKGPFLQISL
jgi:hypothetical protein